MSPSDPATDADAAFEASVNVVDEIEVAGDRTPEPDTDLGLSLDLDLDPDHDGPAPDAGPGYAQQEQHQESHGPQGQSQPVHAGSNETNDDRDTTSRHTRRSRSASAELANGHDRRSRAGSMKSNDHDNEETSRHGMFAIFILSFPFCPIVMMSPTGLSPSAPRVVWVATFPPQPVGFFLAQFHLMRTVMLVSQKDTRPRLLENHTEAANSTKLLMPAVRRALPGLSYWILRRAVCRAPILVFGRRMIDGRD